MREERRREVLERKKANLDENDNKIDNEQPERILHTENDQIISNWRSRHRLFLYCNAHFYSNKYIFLQIIVWVLFFWD